eukprot:806295-Pyramimonas_sp.AAC.2
MARSCLRTAGLSNKGPALCFPFLPATLPPPSPPHCLVLPGVCAASSASRPRASARPPTCRCVLAERPQSSALLLGGVRTKAPPILSDPPSRAAEGTVCAFSVARDFPGNVGCGVRLPGCSGFRRVLSDAVLVHSWAVAVLSRAT